MLYVGGEDVIGVKLLSMLESVDLIEIELLPISSINPIVKIIKNIIAIMKP